MESLLVNEEHDVRRESFLEAHKGKGKKHNRASCHGLMPGNKKKGGHKDLPNIQPVGYIDLYWNPLKIPVNDQDLLNADTWSCNPEAAFYWRYFWQLHGDKNGVVSLEKLSERIRAMGLYKTTVEMLKSLSVCNEGIIKRGGFTITEFEDCIIEISEFDLQDYKQILLCEKEDTYHKEKNLHSLKESKARIAFLKSVGGLRKDYEDNIKLDHETISNSTAPKSMDNQVAPSPSQPERMDRSAMTIQPERQDRPTGMMPSERAIQMPTNPPERFSTMPQNVPVPERHTQVASSQRRLEEDDNYVNPADRGFGRTYSKRIAYIEDKSDKDKADKNKPDKDKPDKDKEEEEKVEIKLVDGYHIMLEKNVQLTKEENAKLKHHLFVPNQFSKATCNLYQLLKNDDEDLLEDFQFQDPPETRHFWQAKDWKNVEECSCIIKKKLFYLVQEFETEFDTWKDLKANIKLLQKQYLACTARFEKNFNLAKDRAIDEENKRTADLRKEMASLSKCLLRIESQNQQEVKFSCDLYTDLSSQTEEQHETRNEYINKQQKNVEVSKQFIEHMKTMSAEADQLRQEQQSLQDILEHYDRVKIINSILKKVTQDTYEVMQLNRKERISTGTELRNIANSLLTALNGIVGTDDSLK